MNLVISHHYFKSICTLIQAHQFLEMILVTLLNKIAGLL